MFIVLRQEDKTHKQTKKIFLSYKVFYIMHVHPKGMAGMYRSSSFGLASL